MFTKPVYLAKSTKIAIRRSSVSFPDDSYEFSTTVGKAIADGDFDTHRGTMRWWAKLDKSEYVNFQDCETSVFIDGRTGRVYINKPIALSSCSAILGDKVVRYDSMGDIETAY